MAKKTRRKPLTRPQKQRLRRHLEQGLPDEPYDLTRQPRRRKRTRVTDEWLPAYPNQQFRAYYELAERYLEDPQSLSEGERYQLAGNPNTHPEILRMLAEDETFWVRGEANYNLKKRNVGSVGARWPLPYTSTQSRDLSRVMTERLGLSRKARKTPEASNIEAAYRLGLPARWDKLTNLSAHYLAQAVVDALRSNGMAESIEEDIEAINGRRRLWRLDNPIEEIRYLVKQAATTTGEASTRPEAVANSYGYAKPRQAGICVRLRVFGSYYEAIIQVGESPAGSLARCVSPSYRVRV